MNPLKIIQRVGLFVSVLSLSGCFGAMMAAAYAPSALMIGGGLYSRIEKADIEAQVHDRKTVQNLKKVAVITVSSKGSEGEWNMGQIYGQTAESLSDHLGSSLRSEGLEVVETMEIEQALLSQRKVALAGAPSEEKIFTKNDLIKGAFDLGADAVLMSRASYGTEMDVGFLGLGGAGRGRTNVTTAEARVFNRHGKTVMNVAIAYKKGEPPQEAGKALGLITAIKIENPDADVKAEIKSRIKG
jgi:hypothetical protein